MPRRSARLSRDTIINSNSNSNISQFGGNGTDHSSGKLRVNSSTPSKLCSTAVRSVQVRKGKPRATENFDEGDYHFNVEDSSNYKSRKNVLDVYVLLCTCVAVWSRSICIFAWCFGPLCLHQLYLMYSYYAFVSPGHINTVTVIRMLSSLFFSSAHIDMVAVLLFGNHSYDSKLQNFRILFY